MQKSKRWQKEVWEPPVGKSNSEAKQKKPRIRKLLQSQHIGSFRKPGIVLSQMRKGTIEEYGLVSLDSVAGNL